VNTPPQLPVFNYEEFLNHQFKSSGNDLVETLVPAGGATLLYSLPKSLKSWIALDLALGAACGRPVLNHFSVPKPVRVLLVQVEDRPGEVQERLLQLTICQQPVRFPDPPDMLNVVPRCPLNLIDPNWFRQLESAIAEQKTELIILDVFRRLFRGDVNTPKDTAEFLEVLDKLRDQYGCAIFLVHHSNKSRQSAMQTHALGSINLTAWADVLVEVKNKRDDDGTTKVDLQIESKSTSVEPTTVVFEHKATPMLIAREAGESDDLPRVRAELSGEFTVKDVERVLGCSDSTASRRVEVWTAKGVIEYADTRAHGQHVYRFKPVKLIG